MGEESRELYGRVGTVPEMWSVRVLGTSVSTVTLTFYVGTPWCSEVQRLLIFRMGVKLGGPYPAGGVAVFLLRLADGGEGLSVLQTHNLVYLAHGWSLGLVGEPLIKEPVRSGGSGPRVSGLVSFVRDYLRTGVGVDAGLNNAAREMVSSVYSGYGSYDGLTTTAIMGELPGSVSSRNVRIPDSRILEHFRNKHLVRSREG